MEGSTFARDFHSFLLKSQKEILTELEERSQEKFVHEEWVRDAGGVGLSTSIRDNTIFERAGVNVSAVWGKLPPEAQSLSGWESVPKDLNFYATGISLVLHPQNPFAPTVHANYRYFELLDLSGTSQWWFGGGADLSPAYVIEEDSVDFHTHLKALCERHGVLEYHKAKKTCDDYFWLSHRDEARGVGGIFFDRLQESSSSKSKSEILGFMQDAASSFPRLYCPILDRRVSTTFNDRHQIWQRLRRGRYVEFNLIHDRGTHFGLKTRGRTKSILMSLPRNAMWDDDHVIAEGSLEDETMQVLRAPREWVK